MYLGSECYENLLRDLSLSPSVMCILLGPGQTVGVLYNAIEERWAISRKAQTRIYTVLSSQKVFTYSSTIAENTRTRLLER